MADDKDMRAVTQKHFKDLISDCPPDALLVVQIVVCGGEEHVLVGVQHEIVEGGPSANVLKSKISEAVREYLKLCPNVAWVAPGGVAPS